MSGSHKGCDVVGRRNLIVKGGSRGGGGISAHIHMGAAGRPGMCPGATAMVEGVAALYCCCCPRRLTAAATMTSLVY